MTEDRHEECNTHSHHGEGSERPAKRPDTPHPARADGVGSSRGHGGAETSSHLRDSAIIGRGYAIDISAHFIELVTHSGRSSATGVADPTPRMPCIARRSPKVPSVWSWPEICGNARCQS